MSQNDLLRAASEAIAMLKGMTDREFIESLENCEPTLAYAVNYAHNRDVFSMSVINSRFLNNSSIDRSLFLQLERDVNSATARFKLKTAMNDSCYALAA